MVVKHVQQDSPPWREPTPIAECGRQITMEHLDRSGFEKVYIAWAEKVQAAERLGEARPPIKETGVCLACWEKLRQYRAWHVDPVNVTLRYLDRVDVGPNWGARVTPEWITAVCELRALEDLVATHRDEFDNLVLRHRGFLTLFLQSRRRP